MDVRDPSKGIPTKQMREHCGTDGRGTVLIRKTQIKLTSGKAYKISRSSALVKTPNRAFDAYRNLPFIRRYIFSVP